jgi:hypothetical protein
MRLPSSAKSLWVLLPVAALAWLLNPIKGTREDVVRIARSQLGKTDPAAYLSAAPIYTAADHKQWCGIWALWVLRQAGLTTWTWKDGLGFLYRLPLLPVGAVPEPGDVAYVDEPNQHEAIVELVVGQLATVIQGNGYGGAVTRSTFPLSRARFYTIRPLLAAEGAP